MKVGIDARALLSEKTGIGVYTDQIVRHLARDPRIELHLFTPREFKPPGGFPGNVRLHSDRHRFGTVWVQTHLPRRLLREECEVFLAPITIVPARIRIPFVPVVHDLTPLTHPEWHRRKVVVAFLPWIEKTLDRAARIIAVSHSTAGELARRFPETASRITVVENGVDRRFSPGGSAEGNEEIRRKYSKGNRFILHLGTLEPRKNLMTLIAACERLWREKRSRPDLLLAGGAGWKSGPLLARIARSPFRDKIHRIGYVPADLAPALYRAAELFCYPSYSEGFGLPLAEAMACGTATVISTADALLETAGGAASAVPADDPAAFAEALARVLEEPGAREEHVRRGLLRASVFCWGSSAEKTAGVLRSALSVR
jgi:glycosyltransferase involved in cell wall biosynthesis